MKPYYCPSCKDRHSRAEGKDHIEFKTGVVTDGKCDRCTYEIPWCFSWKLIDEVTYVSVEGPVSRFVDIQEGAIVEFAAVFPEAGVQGKFECVTCKDGVVLLKFAPFVKIVEAYLVSEHGRGVEEAAEMVRAYPKGIAAGMISGDDCAVAAREVLKMASDETQRKEMVRESMRGV
tara:strand:+ start:575 stop:1099 length:525 start_codon:yes stop_codon:yes gene_type:complete